MWFGLSLKDEFRSAEVAELLKCGSAKSAPNLRNFQPKRRKKLQQKSKKKGKFCRLKCVVRILKTKTRMRNLKIKFWCVTKNRLKCWLRIENKLKSGIFCGLFRIRKTFGMNPYTFFTVIFSRPQKLYFFHAKILA